MTTISDAEVIERLHERERARERDAQARAAALDPAGPCPVCGGVLARGPLHPALAPVRRLPSVKCTRCDFAAPLRPNLLGLALGVAAALALGLVGLTIVLDAQQLTDGTARLVRFAAGAVLLITGFSLGSAVQAAASVKAIGQRIAAARRLREEGPREGPPPSWLGENLRELVFAAILYLILRQFVVEAFVIPTGSMAPTLLGNNYRVECTDCGHRFPVGRPEGAPANGTGSATCTLCRKTFRFDEASSKSDGNKILVNKLLYRLRPPERYEVFVFRNPERPWESYIKRLVGLPGETIEVKGGDLYADGVLQAKPASVQDAVWIPVFDARHPTSSLARLWAPVGEAAPGTYRVAPDGAVIDLAPDAAGEVALEYGRREGVKDTTSYNSRDGMGGMGSQPVGDLRVQARATPAAGATVRLAVVEDDRAVTASFPARGAPAAAFTLEVGGQVIASSTARAPLAPDAPAEVAIAYADDRVRLLVDGETLLDVADEGAPRRAPDRATARVGALGGAARLEALRVDRDIYYRDYPSYSRTDPADGPVTIPPGRYFAMGDNSPSSADSRDWGFVHEGHIQGRAFLVWWPLFDGRLVR